MKTRINSICIKLCFLFGFILSFFLLNSQNLCSTYQNNPDNFPIVSFTNEAINSNGWYEDKMVVVTGKLTINATSVVFWNCRFFMNPGSTIEIQGGKKLKIYYSKIFCCAGFFQPRIWNGIDALSGSYLFLYHSEMEDFIHAIDASYNSYITLGSNTLYGGTGARGVVCAPNNSSQGGLLYLKFYGNTVKNIQTGISLENVSNRIDIGLNSQANLFDGCEYGIALRNNFQIFIKATKIINSRKLGIKVHNDAYGLKDFVFTGLGKHVETLVNNREGHIIVNGLNTNVEITDSKIVTHYEDSPLYDWYGLAITDNANNTLKVDNNNFYCSHIKKETGENIRSLIFILNCTILRDGSSVSNNIFNLSFLENCRSLEVVNSSPQSALGFKINNNELTSYDNLSCTFHLLNSSRFEANGNRFYTSDGDTWDDYFVLHHRYGEKALIKENVITDDSKLRKAIYIEASDDRLCLNKTFGCDRGIYAFGTGMDIYENELYSNATGLTVRSIKPQYHAGNYWLGSNIVEAVCQSDPRASRFTADQNNYGQSTKKYWPTINVTPNWWVHKDTTAPFTCGALPLTGDDVSYLIDTNRHNLLTEIELWENNKFFYKSMLNNPSLLNETSNNSYFQKLDTTNLSKLVKITKGLDELYFIPDNNFELINNLYSQYENINDLYSERLSELEDVDTVFTIEDETILSLMEEIDTISDSIVLILSLNDIDASLLELDSLNEIIDPLNYIEEIEKELNRINIKKLKGDTLDSIEIAYLLAIDSSCLSEYGLLTGRAGSLLPPQYTTEGHQDTCDTESLLRTNTTKNPISNLNFANYYDEKIYLEKVTKINEVMFCNMFGQIIVYKLDLNSSIQNVISVEKLNSGMWFYRFITDEGIKSGSFYKQ